MNEVLFKLNMIKNNNQIVKLKHENKILNSKTIELVDSYKKIIKEYQDKTKNEIDDLKENVRRLEEENKKLHVQNQLYKTSLNKIPNFIVRLFIGRKVKLLKE